MNKFKEKINYMSIFPLLLFVLGTYILFLLIIENQQQAIFVMVISFIIYMTNNVINNISENSNLLNEYLEDMAVFFNFGISTIIFGLIFYKDNLFVLSVVIFYAMTIILGLSRNWILGFKNTKGWPLGLNGLFFPLFFYIYKFYLQGPGDSIFILFYIIVGFLSVSNYNFLSSNSKFLDDFMNPKTKEEIIIKKRVGDEIVEEKINLNSQENNTEKFENKDNLEKEYSNDDNDDNDEKDSLKVNNNHIFNDEKDSLDIVQQEDKIDSKKIRVGSSNMPIKETLDDKEKVKEVFAPKKEMLKDKLKNFFVKKISNKSNLNEDKLEQEEINENYSKITLKDIEAKENLDDNKQTITSNNENNFEDEFIYDLDEKKIIDEFDNISVNKKIAEKTQQKTISENIDDFDNDPNETYIDESDEIIFEYENKIDQKELEEVFIIKKPTLKSKIKKFFYNTFTPNKSKVTGMFQDDKDFGTGVSKNEVEDFFREK